MRFNGEAYSKLFPKQEEPEKVESVVEDNDDFEEEIIEDEPDNLVD